MGSSLLSLDAMHYAYATYGPLAKLIGPCGAASPTTATSTSGYLTYLRYQQPYVVPSVATGLRGYYFVTFVASNEDSPTIDWLGGEFSLGTITGNSGTGSVTGLGAIPARWSGPPYNALISSPAAPRVFVWISTILPAVSPVLTVTYRNQAGTGSRTATITLPSSSAVQTAYDLTPHLQAGDTGVQEVTALSWTNNPATGVAQIMGVLPIGVDPVGISGCTLTISPVLNPVPMWCFVPGDVIAMYRGASGSGSNSPLVMLVGIAETN